MKDKEHPLEGLTHAMLVQTVADAIIAQLTEPPEIPSETPGYWHPILREYHRLQETDYAVKGSWHHWSLKDDKVLGDTRYYYEVAQEALEILELQGKIEILYDHLGLGIKIWVRLPTWRQTTKEQPPTTRRFHVTGIVTAENADALDRFEILLEKILSGIDMEENIRELRLLVEEEGIEIDGVRPWRVLTEGMPRYLPKKSRRRSSRK